jgi:hypothetical protein
MVYAGSGMAIINYGTKDASFGIEAAGFGIEPVCFINTHLFGNLE